MEIYRTPSLSVHGFGDPKSVAYRVRAAELAAQDATRRAIIGAAPVAPPCPACGATDEYVGELCYSCGHGSDPCPTCENERDAGHCYSCGVRP